MTEELEKIRTKLEKLKNEVNKMIIQIDNNSKNKMRK